MSQRLRLNNWLFAICGAVICAAGIALYSLRGFSSYLTLFWLIGGALLLAGAFGLSPAEKLPEEPDEPAAPGLWKAPRIGRTDWWIAGILLLIFVPLYLVGVHDFPRQMNTDEIAIMSTERTLSSQSHVDIFGPSYYSDLPAFIFWFLGKIGVMIGGVNLAHMRLIHASSGVLIIVLCFFLLRMLRLPRFAAVAGTFAIGLCHSLFFISRMAMRDNTAVLFEVIALILLLHGWRRRSYGWTLLGGFMSGLTFYTYYPSRITVAIWLAFLTLLTLKGRFKQWRTALKLAGVMIVGMVIIALPLFIANSKHTPTDPYASHQFLWQSYAQQQEKQYRGTATVGEAIKINIEHGLLAFNKPYTDEGMMYYHPGYGFLDMFTGIILWIGVAAVVVGIIAAKRISESELLALTGFLVVWLSLSFLLTRAPDYTRLMTVMPFLGYMVGRAVMGIADLAVPIFKRTNMRRLVPAFVAGLVIVIIAAGNTAIAADLYRVNNQQGDGTGDTLRFQEKHDTENAAWLFVRGVNTQYFSWGIPTYWRFWLDFGKGDSQPLQMIDPPQLTANQFGGLAPGQHGYLLTTGEVWQASRPAFASHWKVQNVTWLDPAHNRVAVRYASL